MTENPTLSLHTTGPSAVAALGFAAMLLGASLALAAPRAEPEAEPTERPVSFEAQLASLERVPVPGGPVIARFRIASGEYRGGLFTLVYDAALPVRLRSWDVHDAPLYRRVGGGRVDPSTTGQWDWLVADGPEDPPEWLSVTLLQRDLDDRPRTTRLYLTAIQSLAPLENRR